MTRSETHIPGAIQTSETTPSADVYRRPAPTPLRCDTCGELAFGRCPRCGRAFCTDHLMVDRDDRCADCERVLRRTRNRVAFATSIGVLPFAGAAAWLFSFDLLAMVIMPGVVAAVVGSAGGVVWRLLRRSFLAGQRFDPFIEGTQLHIAPRLPGGDAARLGPRALSTDRNRLEPPLTPIWGRTYGR